MKKKQSSKKKRRNKAKKKRKRAVTNYFRPLDIAEDVWQSFCTSRQYLEHEIENVWSEEGYPGDEFINGCGCGRDECEAVASYFSGKTWQQVQVDEMAKGCGSSWDNPINFLSPLAFRYFLPAFFKMFLFQPHQLDLFGPNFVLSLCPHEGWREKVSLIRLGQQKVIVLFLQHIQLWENIYGKLFLEGEIDAGIEFWNRQISKLSSPAV